LTESEKNHDYRQRSVHPPYKADDQDVVVELNNRFGAEAFTAQPTRTGMPVLWVRAPNSSKS
jgi:hypothetical protein